MQEIEIPMSGVLDSGLSLPKISRHFANASSNSAFPPMLKADLVVCAVFTAYFAFPAKSFGDSPHGLAYAAKQTPRWQHSWPTRGKVGRTLPQL
jgi:hypothetical protein